MLFLPVLLIMAVGAYYDAFRMRLVPNTLLLPALPFSLYYLAQTDNWLYLGLTALGILIASLFRLFGAADGKWLLVLLPILGPLPTIGVYFAGTVLTLFGTLPFLAARMFRRKRIKGMLVPMLPGMLVAATAYMSHFHSEPMLYWGLGGVMVVGLIIGIWEKKTKPLPTLEWINTQTDPAAKTIVIEKGRAQSDTGQELKWSKDRHRIFLSTVLTDDGYAALWDKKDWHGKAGSWNIELDNTGNITLSR